MSPQLLLFLTIALGCLLEGEVVILAFAVFATRPRFPLHPVTVALAATLGTMVGDQVVYWLGRLVKDPYELRWRGRRLLPPRRVAQLERYFARHGGKSVFLLRYAFGLRTVGYLFAGAMRMSWTRFTVADTAGSASWAGLLVLLGYSLGWPLLRWVREDQELLFVVPVVLLLAGGVTWLRRRLRRDESGAGPSGRSGPREGGPPAPASDPPPSG